jgi:23S rRNA pseudouridine955/2504/2580 synthase
MLVIDKPEGIAVHGGSGVSFGVIEALRRQRPRPSFLNLAHRLDRETSGILLVGKKRLALTPLHDMFREHGAGADKRYLVLVKGRWMNTTQHVKLPLHKYLTEGGERRVSVNPEGKASHTVFPAFGALAGDEPARGATENRANPSDSRPSGASGFPDSR